MDERKPMKQPNDFEKFTESLYQESPRGWAELEAMRYGIMARLGLDEPEALELAVKIVAGPRFTLRAGREGGEAEKV
jgi:hypothetical protein